MLYSNPYNKPSNYVPIWSEYHQHNILTPIINHQTLTEYLNLGTILKNTNISFNLCMA